MNAIERAARKAAQRNADVFVVTRNRWEGFRHGNYAVYRVTPGGHAILMGTYETDMAAHCAAAEMA